MRASTQQLMKTTYLYYSVVHTLSHAHTHLHIQHSNIQKTKVAARPFVCLFAIHFTATCSTVHAVCARELARIITRCTVRYSHRIAVSIYIHNKLREMTRRAIIMHTSDAMNCSRTRAENPHITRRTRHKHTHRWRRYRVNAGCRSRCHVYMCARAHGQSDSACALIF